VLFPGWWVERPPKGTKLDVWVLNPKGLPAFLEHEHKVLSSEDVHLAAYHLSRYVQAA
jgi:hypothetical protein